MRCAGTAGPPRRRPHLYGSLTLTLTLKPNLSLPLSLTRAAKTGGLRVPAGARGTRGLAHGLARALPPARSPPSDRISLD